MRPRWLIAGWLLGLFWLDLYDIGKYQVSEFGRRLWIHWWREQ